VSAALFIQNGKRIRHIVIGGLSGSTVYLHGTIFVKELLIVNVCYDFV